jgi:hypothetical protein
MKIFDRCRNGRGLCAVALVTALAACAPKPPAIVSLPPAPEPTYLADSEYITQPMVRSGLYATPKRLLSRNLDPQDDPVAAAVDAFMRVCLPLSMKRRRQGPDIDAHVLDPVEPRAPGGGIKLLTGDSFCITPAPDTSTDAAAMAKRLAESPAMISNVGAYVPRAPIWCGFHNFHVNSNRWITPTREDLMVSSVASTPAEVLHGGGHCWVSERTAKYSLVVPALLQALKAAGRDFVPDPAIQDGTLLRQTALVEQRDGITRTILIAAPRGPLRQPHGPPLTLGPAVEIHILPDRFVTRP